MAKPILIQVLVGIALGILLSMVAVQLFGNDLRQSLLLGPLFFLAAGGLAIIAWAGFLAVFRKRMAAAGRGGRFGWSLIAAAIAAIANLVVGSVVGIVVGGGDPFLVVFVFVATLVFGIAALIANLLTNLAIVRPDPAAA